MPYPQYYPVLPYQQQIQQPQIQPPQIQQQIQNGGFVIVRSEEEARNYPVSLGNSVTFKNELAPYIYTKTMGFSQMDRPVFDKYKLVKEEASEPEEVEPDVKEQIAALWKEVEMLKNERTKRTPAKKDKDGDD